MLRALALRDAGVHVVTAAQGAVLVLLAQERLGLGSVGFGLLLAGAAVGGTLGSVVTPWLSRRLFSYGALPLGALVGGVLARGFGLPAPFLVAGGRFRS